MLEEASKTILQATGQSIPLCISLLVGVGAIFTMHRWTLGDMKELVQKNQTETKELVQKNQTETKELVQKNQTETNQRLDRLEDDIKFTQSTLGAKLDQINTRLDMLFTKKE